MEILNFKATYIATDEEFELELIGTNSDAQSSIFRLLRKETDAEEGGEEPEADFPHISFSEEAEEPKVGTMLVVYDTLPPVLGKGPKLAFPRVSAIIQEPDVYYALYPPTGIELGAPVTDEAGRFLGIIQVPRELMREMNRGGASRAQNRVRFEMMGRLSVSVRPAAAFEELLADPEGITDPGRSWLGISYEALEEEMAEGFGIDGQKGLLLTKVVPDSPAHNAGLRTSDILIEFNGEAVEVDTEHEIYIFQNQIRGTVPGQEVDIRILRQGADGTFQEELFLAVLAEPPVRFGQARRLWNEKMGLETCPITYDYRLNRNLPETIEGVVVTHVDGAAWAGLSGLQRWDIVQRVGDTRVANLDSFEVILAGARETKTDPLVFEILRGTETRIVSIDTNW